jgi:hypothetical protein
MSSQDAVRDEADEPPDTDPFDAYVTEIAARLRRVCDTLPDDEFNALVQDIARMRMRLEVLEDLPDGLRPLRDSVGAFDLLPKDQIQS